MLQQVIQTIDGWQSKSASELTSILNAKTIAVPSATPVRYAIEKAYGLTVMVQLRASIRALLGSGQLSASVFEVLDYSNTRLNSDEGMDLSSETAQQQIEGLRAIPQLAPFVDRIKELGVAHRSPWELSEGAGTVDAQQVQAALLSIQKESLIESARNTFEQFRVTVAEWDGIGNAPVMGG